MNTNIDPSCVFRHPAIAEPGRWYGGCIGGLAAERGYGVVRDASGGYIEFLGTAEGGLASGTGGMIFRKSNDSGAIYHEGSFLHGLPDGVVRVERPGRKPQIREFRAGSDVGKGDESRLKTLAF